MKKFLLFLIILCIGSITLLITGCEKEKDVLKADQVVIDQANKGVVKYKKTINMYDGSKFDIIITDKGVIYPPITDEYFERLTSGYVTLPEHFVPSLKFKTIILEMLGDHEKRVMDLKGVHLYFDENLAKQYETDYGRTMVQSYYDYLISVGIDPSLPQEERDRLEHEIQKKRTDELELRAPSANAVFTNVPHYYEFNSLENPNGYYWCGHASLKGVGMKHGTYRTLGQIHSAFCSGSSAYCSDSHCGGNRYCAKLQDLHWMAINQNGNPLNYNFTTSTVESIGSLTNFYQKIVNGVTYHKPYIVPSNYYYGTVGHFYAVVGYDTKYILPGVIDYNLSNVYLRDVADPIPNNTNWDLEVSANVFYTNRVGTQMLIVRPGSYI